MSDNVSGLVTRAYNDAGRMSPPQRGEFLAACLRSLDWADADPVRPATSMAAFAGVLWRNYSYEGAVDPYDFILRAHILAATLIGTPHDEMVASLHAASEDRDRAAGLALALACDLFAEAIVRETTYTRN